MFRSIGSKPWDVVKKSCFPVISNKLYNYYGSVQTKVKDAKKKQNNKPILCGDKKALP